MTTDDRSHHLLDRLQSNKQALPYAIVIILLLTFAVYAPTLGYGFVYDDQHQIVTHDYIKSWQFAPRYFSENVWAYLYPGEPGNYYRPLFLCWLLINFSLFGLTAFWWHLTTIAAHLLTTFLVYLLARKISGNYVIGLLTALIFGVHPVHIEAVAWISAVNESLMTIFFLLSLLCFLSQRAVKEPDAKPGAWRLSVQWLLPSLVFYGFALLSKETAIVLPLIVGLLVMFFPQPDTTESLSVGQRLKQTGLFLLPYLALTGIYLAVRVAALGGLAPAAKNLPFATLIYTLPAILWFYSRLLVWPIGLSAYYDHAQVTAPGLWTFAAPLAGLLIIAGAGFLWIKNLRDKNLRRLICFSGLWLIITLVPVMNLSAFYETEIAHDRYLYLPSFGFSIIVALMVCNLPVTRKKLFGWSAAQALAVIFLTLYLGLGTVLQLSFWKDDLTFYAHGVNKSPKNPFARINLADVMYARQMFESAIEQYKQVLTIAPQDWHSNYRLGLLYGRFGRHQDAEQHFRRAIEINANNANQYFYLGFSLYELGQIEQSIEAERRALEINPNTANAHYVTGLGLKRKGDWQNALREFQAESAINPEHPEVKKQIAELEGKLK